MASIIKKIKDDSIQRNISFNRINKYLNDTYPKELGHIIEFLTIELSCFATYYISYTEEIKQIYTQGGYFSNYTTHLYFPKDNLKVIVSQRYAESLYYIAQILLGNFKEKMVTFRYYNMNLEKICRGPQIIICMIEPAAIICNNGKNLDEMIRSCIY